MIITREADGRVILRPGDETELVEMRDFFAAIPEAAALTYGGRSRHPVWSRFDRPFFEYQQGSIILTGSSEEDARQASSLRALCYAGRRVQINFVQSETNEQGLVVTLMIFSACKGCGRPLIEAAEAEWATCATCVERCDHSYVLGGIHGGVTKDGKSLDIGVGWYCTKCGTVRQDEGHCVGDKTLREHNLAAAAAGVVDAIIVL